MRIARHLIPFAIFLASTLCLAQKPPAASQPIWRIGIFNQSPSEFNTGNKGAPLFGSRYPKGELVYIVGKSNPAIDWPAYQLASTRDTPGAHPYIIQFDLQKVPHGIYTLKIGLLSETARVAELQADINGHTGLFYQHPKLSYSAGDRDMLTLPIASTDTISFDLPTKFLHKGTNRLALTAVDEPTDERGHGAIAYDALELDHDSTSASTSGVVTVQAIPTIFYVRQSAGLSELVDVYVRSSAAFESGEVVLKLGSSEFRQPLSAEEFGEQKVEYSVPEFAADLQGAVDVTADGHTQHFGVTLSPGKKWNLLVVPNAHLDIGYTDYQAKVAEIQSRILDEAVQLVHDHPDFRYSVDGYWSVRQFMAGRSEQRQQQLFEMIREKKIFVPTVEANLLTGFPSLETLIRSLYPAFEFHQKYGGDADYVNITDVPTYSWSYASVMAAAGLKYFVAGSNMDDAPSFIDGRLNEQSPFYWEGPDGGKILMWFSWDYAQMSILFGGEQGEIAAGHDAIPRFLQAYSHPGYKSNSVLVFGSQWENTDLYPRQASIGDDWNAYYAYPHFQYSGFADALRTIANGFGDSIPVMRGDGGPYWEYGIASLARTAAIERENEQRGPAAEKFSTISSLIDPQARPDRQILAQMWNNMVLCDEHTWGADLTVFDPKSEQEQGELAVKKAFAQDAKHDIDYVLRRSLASLADSIYDPRGTLLVFNPLNWQRSSLVETDLNTGTELIDLTTHQPVPYEVLTSGQFQRRVRFLAKDVPSVGYKAYMLKKTNVVAPAAHQVSGDIVENRFYRIVLDAESGSVKSIYDRELDKELVDSSSPYKFDQYLYVTGGDQSPNRLLAYTSTSPIPKLTIHDAGSGHLISIMNEPFGVVARMESSGLNTPQIETQIILFSGSKKIEFINHVHKTEVYSKEGVYFAFPLAMKCPQFRYETQNGFVNPAIDQLPGAGKESFSVQHWVAADQDGAAAAIVPLDSSLITLGDIMRGTWPQQFGRRTGTIFSQVMDNYWYTNFAAGQGGDFTFRYVVTSGRSLEPAFLSRLGREEMSPLEVDRITNQDKAANTARPLAPTEGSFLTIDQPDTDLVTWKEAEDGNGTVMRFLELAGKPAEVNVETPLLNIQAAWLTDALERNKEQLSNSPHAFRFAIKPFQIVTIRLVGTSVIEPREDQAGPELPSSSDPNGN